LVGAILDPCSTVSHVSEFSESNPTELNDLRGNLIEFEKRMRLEVRTGEEAAQPP